MFIFCSILLLLNPTYASFIQPFVSFLFSECLFVTYSLVSKCQFCFYCLVYAAKKKRACETESGVHVCIHVVDTALTTAVFI